ncbi:MAG: hypothetical protein Ct9H300mP32_6210 [Verrucomicrobiota bacterium]|nr:MAG: hypothetical protein Ct9H300mP32_6210 [Verrucomicrobiota bacterium]
MGAGGDLLDAGIALIVLADLLECHLDARGAIRSPAPRQDGSLLQITDDNNLAPSQRLFVRSRIGLLYRLAGKHERRAQRGCSPEARLGQAFEGEC